MIKEFSEILYGEPVEYESAYSLEESCDRLAKTKTPVEGLPVSQVAIGTVTESKVEIGPQIWVGPAFYLRFRGHFCNESGRIKLKGKLEMPLIAQVFMTIWFVGILFMTLLAAFHSFGDSIFGITMFLIGVAFIRVGQWLGRKNTVWIRSHIKNALSPDVANPSIERGRLSAAPHIRRS